MPLGRLAENARAAWEVPRDLLLGRYPPFVTGGALPRGHVPVFVFHSLEPRSFSRKLDYLAQNHYVTLSGGEYFQVLTGGAAAPERAVLLTFDDGRGSLWSVAYPLLRRRGMRGVVFLVPGRIRSDGPPGPTWDDVTGNPAAEQALLTREQGEGAFLAWEEVRLLAESGVFEFHSHTQSHARIHTGPQVAGFLTPEARQGVDAMDVPLIHSGNRDLFAEDVPLGTPLLRAEARTSEALRFFEEPAFRAACVERVAAEGGAPFFARKDWLQELRQLIGQRSAPGRYETPDEREQAIRRELEDARDSIEERTGSPANHLCFPWHVSGPTARRVARQVGYLSSFCGKVAGVPITLPGGDPQAIARIGEDYLERLPGAGRLDLMRVLRRKWARRLGRSVVP
jgi:peptidoglycan/xylan/chitin deacetylase (PgdA/CDA1 family)